MPTTDKLYNDHQLLDVSALDLQSVPDRTYRILDPIPEGLALDLDVIFVENEHLNMVRENSDECSEIEIYVTPYLVGRTTTDELLFVVVHTETRDHCFYIDEKGIIDGGGTGHSHLVICPADAEATLLADCTKLARELCAKWVRGANESLAAERESQVVAKVDRMMEVFVKMKPEAADNKELREYLLELARA